MVLSLGSICALQLTDIDMKTKDTRTPALFRYGIFVVVVVYDMLLLWLSSESGRITRTARKSLRGKMGSEEAEVMDVAESRHTRNLWMVAICQSGLAIIGLFVMMTTIQVFGRCSGRAGYSVVECFELVLGLGQMVLMASAAICCVIRDTVSLRLEIIS